MYGRKGGEEGTKTGMSFRIIKQSIINPGQNKKKMYLTRNISGIKNQEHMAKLNLCKFKIT